MAEAAQILSRFAFEDRGQEIIYLANGIPMRERTWRPRRVLAIMQRRSQEEPHRTLFAVVPDGFDVEALVAATERITGPFNQPHTGIMFAVPVTRAWGLHRKKPSREN